MRSSIDENYILILDRELTLANTYLIIIKMLDKNLDKLKKYEHFIGNIINIYSYSAFLHLAKLFDSKRSSNSLIFVIKKVTDKEKKKDFMKEVMNIKTSINYVLDRRHELIAHSSITEDEPNLLFKTFSKDQLENTEKAIKDIEDLLLRLREEFGYDVEFYHIFQSWVDECLYMIKGLTT